jgi:hypothetical protein
MCENGVMLFGPVGDGANRRFQKKEVFPIIADFEILGGFV